MNYGEIAVLKFFFLIDLVDCIKLPDFCYRSACIVNDRVGLMSLLSLAVTQSSHQHFKP